MGNFSSSRYLMKGPSGFSVGQAINSRSADVGVNRCHGLISAAVAAGFSEAWRSRRHFPCRPKSDRTDVFLGNIFPDS